MKSEVYSWRLSPVLKTELEEAARAEKKSLAQLLEQIAGDWLSRPREGDPSEEERQQRIRAAVLKTVGTIHGGDPDGAQNARTEVRARIARRHGQ
jgi:predicted DNA-binding ribbon-helix-helix protein